MTTPKLLIEIRGGNIVYMACTNNLNIVIIDHDLDESSVNTYEPDNILSHKELNNYIDEITNEEK